MSWVLLFVSVFLRSRTTRRISIQYPIIIYSWPRLRFNLQNILSVVSIAAYSKRRKLKYFLASGNFPRKADSVILLALDCIHIPREPSWLVMGIPLPLYVAYIWRRRVIGISGSLIWSKTLMELIFNPWGKFQWSPEGPVSRFTLLTSTVVPLDLFISLRSVQMLKREWGAESNGKLMQLVSPCSNCSLGSWVCSGKPAFGRTAAFVPTLPVKDLFLSRTLMILNANGCMSNIYVIMY